MNHGNKTMLQNGNKELGLQLANQCYMQFNKLASVFLCVRPVIDHEFCHHTVKVAVDPRGDTDYFDNVMTKFMINNRIDA